MSSTPEKTIRLEGRTVGLVQEYLKVWQDLLREGPSTEWAAFHNHMVQRVLMDDSDPPNVRIGLAIGLMGVCDQMSNVRDSKRRLIDATMQNSFAQMKELFEQIANGDEAELRLPGPDGVEKSVIFENGCRRVRRQRDAVDNSGLSWTFSLSPYRPGPSISPRYMALATHLLTPFGEILEKAASGEVGREKFLEAWLIFFERCVRRALLSAHEPPDLRRAHAGAAVAMFAMLAPEAAPEEVEPDADELDAIGLDAGRVLGREDNLNCLREITGQIADGNPLLAVLSRGDLCLMSLLYKDGRRQIVSCHEEANDIDESDLVAALVRVRQMDLKTHDDPAPERAGRQRKRPRPNESCSCGSGRKYKRCCGSH